MSNVEVVHTDHIKPARLKELTVEVLELAQKLMKNEPESGEGWSLVNAAMALRKYNDILEQAYISSLTEGYGAPTALVTRIHDEIIIEPKRYNK